MCIRDSSYILWSWFHYDHGYIYFEASFTTIMVIHFEAGFTTIMVIYFEAGFTPIMVIHFEAGFTTIMVIYTLKLVSLRSWLYTLKLVSFRLWNCYRFPCCDVAESLPSRTEQQYNLFCICLQRPFCLRRKKRSSDMDAPIEEGNIVSVNYTYTDTG